MTTPLRIARGDRGEAVRDLKARLGALGYTLPAGDLAGEAADVFGPPTETAVRTFQSARGLRVDGVCGPETWGALVESGFSLGDRLLYLRQPMLRGDDVAELQRAMNALGFDAGKEDGIFGPDTEHAVREFQRNAGLTVDAIAGPDAVGALDRIGRDRDGSVALVRERETLLATPRELDGRRVFLAVEPGLEALADVVRGGLTDGHAEVVVEAAGDHSALAGDANRFGADLVLLLRLGQTPGCACAFYESGAFRSERGQRVAACILESVGDIVGTASAQPVGKTYAILRETKAPAVVCEPVSGDDPDGMELLVTKASDIGRALVAGVRRAVEVPADD